jgi:hypothetical protein
VTPVRLLAVAACGGGEITRLAVGGHEHGPGSKGVIAMATWIHRVVVDRCLQRAIVRLSLAAVLCASVTSSALSQIAARPDKGLRPAGSYAVSDIENINLTNGNVGLSIPLASLPPIAGRKLSWTIAANYNSKMWDMVHHEQLDSSQPPDQQPTRWMTSQLNQSTISPWVIGGSYRIDVSESKNDVEWGDPHCHPQQQWCEPDYDLMLQHHEWYKVTLTTPDGATHELRPIDGFGIYTGSREYLLRYDWRTPKTTNTTMLYYSYDGSYLWAAIQPFVGTTPLNWDIYTNDGTHIQNRSGTGPNSGQFIFDTNGNSIRIYGTATGAVNTTHFVDQRTGREIRYVFDPAPNQGWGQGKVEYKAVEGNTWISILINFRATTVHGWSYFTNDQPCGSSAELINQGQQDFTVVDSIVLPETETGVTRQFSFEYNSDTSFTTSYQYTDQFCLFHNVNSVSRGLGSLSKMTTPSGAQASYSYSLDIPAPQQGQNAVAGVLDAVEFPGETLNKKI